MKRYIGAAAACCCLAAGVHSEPTQAVGNTAPKQSNAHAAASENERHPEKSALPAIEIPRATSIAQQQSQPEPKEVKAAPQKRETEGWGVTEWTAILNAVGALVTALFTVVLGIFTKKMWRTAKDTATIAENSLNASMASTRAYIYATSARLLYTSIFASPKIEIVLRNYGKTPAAIVGLKSKFCVGGAEWIDASILQLPAFYLGEGIGDSLMVQLAITEVDADLIHEGKKPLELSVDIQYKDVTGTLFAHTEVFIFSSDVPYGFLHENSPCTS